MVLEVRRPALIWRDGFTGARACSRLARFFLALILDKIAGPGDILHLKANGLSAIGKVKEKERQFCASILVAGGAGKRRSQPGLIESGASSVFVRIDKDEFRSPAHSLPVPEPVGLLNPVGRHV